MSTKSESSQKPGKPRKTGMLWIPVQRLRLALGSRLGFAPNSEAEILYRQLMLVQMRMAQFNANFKNIVVFMDVCNANFVNISKRLEKAEKALGLANDENEGGYVQ